MPSEMPSLKPRVLILGGGYADIPMINAIKSLGYVVVSTGNVPDSPGHRYSDIYEFGDFSNCEEMLTIARRHNVVGCVPSCNDFAAISATYVSEALGLAGFDSSECAMILHHKDKFRDFCESAGIPAPSSARSFTRKDDAIAYVTSMESSAIVKPVDLTGGKGISVLGVGEDPGDAISKAFSITKAGRIVIETFVEGSRHGYSAIIVSRKVAFGFLDNEHYAHNPFMVAAASVPPMLTNDVGNTLACIVEQIANTLDLVDGVFHVQFIMSVNGPVIIEVCRRPPGDLYVEFVSRSTGCDYAKAIVQGFLGLTIDVPQAVAFPSPFVRYCVMSEQFGVVKNVGYSAELRKMVVDEYRLWSVGDLITNPLVYKYSILFLRLDNELDIINQVDKIRHLINIEMEPS